MPATADLKILKVDANGMTTTLAGAKFELRKINPDNTSLEYLDIDATLPATNGSDSMTGSVGVAIFAEITDGYYEFKETVLPDGYVLTDSGAFYIHVDDGTVTLVEIYTII